MNQGRTIFQQITESISRYEFQKCVKRYRGDKNTRTFTCWDQFMCMLFAQLSGRESLRDIVVCLRSKGSKLYHLGIRGKVSRNTLSYANANRDWRIYRDYALTLIRQGEFIYKDEVAVSGLEKFVYILDSTVIDLCLSLCPWAKFSEERAALKLHTLLSLKGDIPSFAQITGANYHDVNMLDEVIFIAGAFYILDRAYLHFKRLYDIHLAGAFFVVRAKRKLLFHRLSSQKITREDGLKCDQVIQLRFKPSKKQYPERLRRIVVFDSENNNRIVLLTNNFKLSPLTITELYKERWKVELFFKWIKQHLRIKTFYGTNENAVKIQIWTALASYLLVALLKKNLKIQTPLYTILQIASVSLFDKTPVITAINNQKITNFDVALDKQLNLF